MSDRKTHSVRITEQAKRIVRQMAHEDGISQQELISSLILEEERARAGDDEPELLTEALFREAAKSPNEILEELTFKEGIAPVRTTSMPVVKWAKHVERDN